ncbi:MAG: nucleotidyltransferase family protein [Oscillospiraceae bacterium]|nr:nucleotidyltransferase family protein [Oscillospiraceae bacterium]
MSAFLTTTGYYTIIRILLQYFFIIYSINILNCGGKFINTAAIICEYNPFHNGHMLQIKKIRELFPDKAILCLMSGNFVQRAEVAVADKYTRAKCAAECGANLVLELPFPFSMMSAEGFAAAGISILNRIPGVDTLVFGAENDDSEHLMECAKILISPLFKEVLHSELEKNPSLSYPAVRQLAAELITGKSFDMMKKPNNILAIEYCKAIINSGSVIMPAVHARSGPDYYSLSPDEGISSATYIRHLLSSAELSGGDGKNCSDIISRFVPAETLPILDEAYKKGLFPTFADSLDKLILFTARTQTPDKLKEVYSCDSLEYLIIKNAHSCSTVKELIDETRSKRFTESRVRRAVLSVLLNISRRVVNETPSYTVVLAADITGRKILHSIKKAEGLHVFTKPAHALRSKDPNVSFQAVRAFNADSTYTLACKGSLVGDYFTKCGPFVK